MITQAQETLAGNAAAHSPETYYSRKKMTPNGVRTQFNRSSNESLTSSLVKRTKSPKKTIDSTSGVTVKAMMTPKKHKDVL